MISFRIAAALVAATLFAACGGGEKKNGGGGGGGDKNRLVIAFDGSPSNLDPRVGTDTLSGRIWDMTASGLIKLTPSGDFTGDLATKWDTPDDKTIVFHLNPNAKFQDGKPVTSADVKFTYESLMSESFPSKAKQSGYASVAAFEAPDPHTFVIKLKEPNAGIFDNLTYMCVPQGSDPAVFARKPVLAGAYKVNEFRIDERLELEAFDGWVGGKPNIKNITVRIIPDATTRVLELKRGSVQFAINSVPLDQVAPFKNDSENFNVQTSHGGSYQYIAFNLKDPILGKKQVRQALAHAIDREQIVRDLLKGYGKVTESLFPPGHWARNENVPTYPYDPNKAKQLLDAAGHRDPDGDGPQPRFRLSYKTSTDEEANQQAQMIQQMLKGVGVELQIQSSELGTFMEDIKSGRYQMYSLRRAGISDPDFFTTIFHSKSIPPNGQNRGYWINPRVDQLIEEGRSTFDRAKRKAAYDEVQRLQGDELPYISLYHRDNVAIMRKNVKGFEMYPSGFLLSVPKMTVE